MQINVHDQFPHEPFTAFVSFTRSSEVSLIFFAITVDVTRAINFDRIPIAANITRVAIAFPMAVTG